MYVNEEIILIKNNLNPKIEDTDKKKVLLSKI